MKQPEPVTFECTLLTRAFVGAADNREAELTEGGLLGGLHFWTRAMLGAVVPGPEQRKKIAWLEGRLWGMPSRAAGVAVRCTAHGEPERVGYTSPLREGDFNGLHYFAGMGLSGRNYAPGRKYYPAGTSFTVELRPLRPEPMLRRAAVVAFWLLAHCGGIGSRSRRGMGSFAADPGDPVAGAPEFGPAEEDLAAWYQAQFNAAHACFYQWASATMGAALAAGDPLCSRNPCQPETDFPSFGRWCASVSQAEPAEGEVVLEWLGRRFREYRTVGSTSTRTPDYVGTVDPFIGGRLNGPAPRQVTIPNAIFGLPYPFRSKSRGTPVDVNWPKMGNAGRRASPLILRVVRAQGGCTSLALLLQSRFLNGQEVWMKTGRNWPKNTPLPTPPAHPVETPSYAHAEGFVAAHGALISQLPSTLATSAPTAAPATPYPSAPAPPLPEGAKPWGRCKVRYDAKSGTLTAKHSSSNRSATLREPASTAWLASQPALNREQQDHDFEAEVWVTADRKQIVRLQLV